MQSPVAALDRLFNRILIPSWFACNLVPSVHLVVNFVKRGCRWHEIYLLVVNPLICDGHLRGFHRSELRLFFHVLLGGLVCRHKERLLLAILRLRKEGIFDRLIGHHV